MFAQGKEVCRYLDGIKGGRVESAPRVLSKYLGKGCGWSWETLKGG